MTREEILAQPALLALNHYLSIATLIASVVLVVWLVMIIIRDKNTFLTTLATYATRLAFFATLAGSLLSLFYSEVLLLVPCELCWYQRILLYPQVVLFAVAWWRKDHNVWVYSLALSVFGGVIALYHHALQMGYDLYKPCSTAPFAADCSKPEFIEFGFITFPFMSFVMFATLVLLYITHRRYPKTDTL